MRARHLAVAASITLTTRHLGFVGASYALGMATLAAAVGRLTGGRAPAMASSFGGRPITAGRNFLAIEYGLPPVARRAGGSATALRIHYLTAHRESTGHPARSDGAMEGENEMIPMGGEDEVEGPDVPPTVKERNAAQQEVSRLLDILAPERTANRMGGKDAVVERHRTPRGCILQAAAGAVSVSWFADSAQGAELGELQVVAWRGTVSRPGSSQRASGAKPIEELVLRPVENRMGDLHWRATDGTTFTTDALAARCAELLDQWISASPG